MRPIDADELKAAFPYSGLVRTEFFRATIDHMPTIEPERMRGKWVGVDYDGYADGNQVYYTWKCSVCNCLVEDEEPTWNYCPNCGTEMGEQNET